MTTSHLDIPGIRSHLEAGTEPRRIIHALPGTIPRAESQLWRFMDFSKLVSLLDRKALFFTRAHKLEDQFEGTWSKATVLLLQGTTLRETVEADGYITLYDNTTEYGLILIRPYSSITDPTERALFDSIISQGPSSETRSSSYRGYENSTVIHHIPTYTDGPQFYDIGRRKKRRRQGGSRWIQAWRPRRYYRGGAGSR